MGSGAQSQGLDGHRGRAGLAHVQLRADAHKGRAATLDTNLLLLETVSSRSWNSPCPFSPPPWLACLLLPAMPFHFLSIQQTSHPSRSIWEETTREWELVPCGGTGAEVRGGPWPWAVAGPAGAAGCEGRADLPHQPVRRWVWGGGS